MRLLNGSSWYTYKKIGEVYEWVHCGEAFQVPKSREWLMEEFFVSWVQSDKAPNKK